MDNDLPSTQSLSWHHAEQSWLLQQQQQHQTGAMFLASSAQQQQLRGGAPTGNTNRGLKSASGKGKEKSPKKAIVADGVAGEQEAKGQCNVCDKVLPSKEALTAHLLDHW